MANEGDVLDAAEWPALAEEWWRGSAKAGRRRVDAIQTTHQKALAAAIVCTERRWALKTTSMALNGSHSRFDVNGEGRREGEWAKGFVRLLLNPATPEAGWRWRRYGERFSTVRRVGFLFITAGCACPGHELSNIPDISS